MSNILELINVSKSYEHFSLKNINFSLERGYIMGFIGPNGAGKSTTIKLMMNLVKKETGQVNIFGLDNEKHAIAIKDKIGFVYDEIHFYEELTVQEMKNVIRPFYSQWDERLFNQYVNDFNLPLKKPIKHLSKGMKMKFSLAIALSHHAELLIMDEPTSGLDPLIRNELLDILQSIIQDANKSVFFSTHITSDLDKIADYITLIHDGEILLSKTKDELMDEYCIVKGSKDVLSSMQQEHLVGIKENRYGFEALARDKRGMMKRFGDSVIFEKPTLEEIMLFTIRRGESSVSSY